MCDRLAFGHCSPCLAAMRLLKVRPLSTLPPAAAALAVAAVPVLRPSLVPSLVLAPALLLSEALPAIAHQVELAEDVGATLHIEPNDTPRAGEEVLAWFALTKKGGVTVPLSDCDCTIEVFSQSDKATPIATPKPQAVNSEGYQGIPGAAFTFPNVGAYTLVISGKPQAGAGFSPFELAFDVTVAAGAKAKQSAPLEQTVDSAVSDAETPGEPGLETTRDTATGEDTAGGNGKWVGVGIVGSVVLGAIALKLKR